MSNPINLDDIDIKELTDKDLERLKLIYKEMNNTHINTSQEGKFDIELKKVEEEIAKRK